MSPTSQKILLISIAFYVGSCVAGYMVPDDSLVVRGFTISHLPASPWDDLSACLMIIAIGLTVAAIVMRRR